MNEPPAYGVLCGFGYLVVIRANIERYDCKIENVENPIAKTIASAESGKERLDQMERCCTIIIQKDNRVRY